MELFWNKLLISRATTISSFDGVNRRREIYFKCKKYLDRMLWHWNSEQRKKRQKNGVNHFGLWTIPKELTSKTLDHRSPLEASYEGIVSPNRTWTQYALYIYIYVHRAVSLRLRTILFRFVEKSTLYERLFSIRTCAPWPATNYSQSALRATRLARSLPQP